MSIELLTLCDQINWLEVRKIYNLSIGATDLLKYICWRQGDKPPYAVYIPEKRFFEHTGRHSSSFYDNLKELTDSELVIRTVRGSNVNKTTANLRANEKLLKTLPNLTDNELRNTGDSKNTYSGIGESDTRYSGARTPVKRSSDSGIGDPKLNKLNKTKLNEIDKTRLDISKVKRFEKLMVQLLPDRRELLTYGKNLDPYLDAIEIKDPEYTYTANQLNKVNISTPYDVSAVLVKELARLAGVKFESKNSNEVEWCGNEYCDKTTRQFPERDFGVDGELTYDCPVCNPRQLALANRLSTREHADTMFKGIEGLFKTPD